MNFEEFLPPEDIDVQKAVVESLAADKAEQDVKIDELRAKINELHSRIATLENQLSLKSEELVKAGDLLAKNADDTVVASSKIALLDRELELDENFPGEMRDHVIEVLREARDAAEKEGRARRAQILEAVLVANEPVGTLAKKRAELEKLFIDNSYVVNGQVINTLNKLGISHKHGEDYLLPSEIIKRNY